MKKHLLVMAVVTFIMSMLAGCGGGGGGGSDPNAPGGGNNNGNNPPAPTKALVRISATGTPSATPLIGAQATVHLPAGVSVGTMLNSTQTGTNVVTASGNTVPLGQNDLVFGVFTAATRTVGVYVVRLSGFTAGEFAAVNCDIAAGTSPQLSDFSVTDLTVSDANGIAVTGLTPTIAVSMQ